MIKYDWKQIKVACKNHPPTIVYFLKHCLNIPGSPRISSKLKLLSEWGVPKGKSYILNLKDVLQDSSVSAYDIVQYVELCSRRNFAGYKFHKTLSLPALVAHDTNVQYNRLITVDDRQIYFKYETEETEKWR